MSLLVRSSLVLVQALCNQIACTPPNKTPSKGRYHTEEASILQLAPLMFKVINLLALLLLLIKILLLFRSTQHFYG